MKHRYLAYALPLACAAAHAQVPDLVNALDAGGRALGMGGATNVTGSDTLSNYHNPAGLSFISRPTLGSALRNMPQTTTVVTGDIGPGGIQHHSTTQQSGPTGLGHVGLAIPMWGGAVALSLTAAGQLRDTRVSGTGLVEGGLDAAGYVEFTKLDTDMVNLSYGRGTKDGTFAWGFGAVYAISRQVHNRYAPSGITKFDALANGFGFQGGILMTPKENPDLTFGLSYRTPIKLRKSGSPLIDSQIPGRLEAGVALRRNGFRASKGDFVILGLDFTHFFDSDSSSTIDRDPQSVVGAGIEYNFMHGNYRLPVRLGYSAVSAGGDYFGRRNSLTYGFGIRPASSDWGIDLNFGKPTGGGPDFSIAATYRFGK